MRCAFEKFSGPEVTCQNLGTAFEKGCHGLWPQCLTMLVLKWFTQASDNADTSIGYKSSVQGWQQTGGVLLYKCCLMTGQRQQSCVVRLSWCQRAKSGFRPLLVCLALPGSQPRCGSISVHQSQEPGCAYIYMVASLTLRRFLGLGVMTDPPQAVRSLSDGRKLNMLEITFVSTTQKLLVRIVKEAFLIS